MTFPKAGDPGKLPWVGLEKTIIQGSKKAKDDEEEEDMRIALREIEEKKKERERG